MMGMMTCREVSTLVSTGRLAEEPFVRRLAVWVHLSMCRHCRAFRRQIRTLARVAGRVAAGFAEEPSRDLEKTIINRLSK